VDDLTKNVSPKLNHQSPAFSDRPIFRLGFELLVHFGFITIAYSQYFPAQPSSFVASRFFFFFGKYNYLFNISWLLFGLTYSGYLGLLLQIALSNLQPTHSPAGSQILPDLNFCCKSHFSNEQLLIHFESFLISKLRFCCTSYFANYKHLLNLDWMDKFIVRWLGLFFSGFYCESQVTTYIYSPRLIIRDI
jgi:hypothetical protein